MRQDRNPRPAGTGRGVKSVICATDATSYSPASRSQASLAITVTTAPIGWAVWLALPDRRPVPCAIFSSRDAAERCARVLTRKTSRAKPEARP